MQTRQLGSILPAALVGTGRLRGRQDVNLDSPTLNRKLALFGTFKRKSYVRDVCSSLNRRCKPVQNSSAYLSGYWRLKSAVLYSVLNLGTLKQLSR